MTTAVRKIVQEVKALSREERRELEAVLRELELSPTDATSGKDAASQLAAQGVVTPAQRAPRRSKPVPITGQPVSEIIIAERR